MIQDILIEGPDGHTPVADQPVGWLATTVTLYDALEKDIRRAEAVDPQGRRRRRAIRFPDSAIHQEVAKTVAVLQILGNMPVTAQNVASLMHPASRRHRIATQVDAAIKDLINDGMVPFGEKDGSCASSARSSTTSTRNAPASAAHDRDPAHPERSAARGLRARCHPPGCTAR